MHNCQLIIDSCSDIPPALADKEDLILIEFPYIVDEETHYDDLFQSTTAKQFYDSMRKGKEPSTSQLQVVTLQETFKQAAENGLPAVFISFSGGLSGSYDVACLVRDQILEEYPDFELFVVDSKLASIAEGLMVYEAINQWEKGASARELAQWVEEANNFVSCEFMVEDLDSLKRGGRIPAGVAAAGTALDVKPMLTIDLDGTLKLVGVARGRKKGIKQLASYYEKNRVDSGPGQYVFLGNADCPKDMERLKDELIKIDPDLLFFDCSIGPVIGSHVGPGMIALAFWGQDKRETLSVADRIARRIKKED